MDLAGIATGATQRPLRLLVLVPKPQGLSPGQRFRLEQWAPHLAEHHGIALDFLPFESPALTKVLYQPGRHFQKAALVAKDFARRLSAVVKSRRYDGVVIYREAALIGPGIYERLLAALKVPIFFDFDDAIWREGEQQSSASGFFSRLHFWGKTSATCRLASAVLVGNEYLADYARARNDRVFVLPTSIELADYPVQPEFPDDEPFTICWTGSHSTLSHFSHARSALERLGATRKVVVRIICNREPKPLIAGVETLYIPWSAEGEAEAVGRAHVGIMPLPDTEYTRGKCGLKALQYMATGLPVVVSPVGMNVDLVRSGENGYLAGSDDDWVNILTTLAGSRDLRRRIGAAGRATVEQEYSGQAVASKLADAIRSTLR